MDDCSGFLACTFYGSFSVPLCLTYPTSYFIQLHVEGTLGLEKNCLFPVKVRKNRVDRSVNFLSKMCVLCMFYVDWELGGQKKIWGRDFF